jgi:hypothetical protein
VANRNIPKLLTYIGLIWSLVATTYVGGQYFSLKNSEMAIQALNPGDDLMLEKIGSMDMSNGSSKIILNELKQRHDHLVLFYRTLEKQNIKELQYISGEILLWLGVSGIFALVIVITRGERV